jgi:hypothetical protein
MRALLSLGVVCVGSAVAAAGGHGSGRCGLVGFGPVNPYQWTMTADLYTTDMAPTFREFHGGGVRAPIPINSADQNQRVTPKQGSIPSIVLPPPNTIPNPQLAPPPPTPGTTSGLPPAPTPASVKPSSSGTVPGSRR